MKPKAIVLTDGMLHLTDAKTAHGLIRGTDRYEIAAVIDSKHAGKDAGEVLDGKHRNIPVLQGVESAIAEIKNIESKVLKAQKTKEEQSVNQINKLRDKLFPSGSMQEREENILQYIAQYGFSFLDELKNNIEAVPKEFLILEI